MIYAENILVCLAMPLLVAAALLRGTARRYTLFLLLGMVSCLLSAYCNSFLTAAFDISGFDAVVKLTPLCEETVKMLPILFYVLLLSPERRHILPAAVAVGVGFATFENCCYIVQYGSEDVLFLLVRGLAAGTMHTMTTAFLGAGLTYAAYRRFYRSFVSMFGLWCAACSVHSIYNILVSSGDDRAGIGYAMPILLCGAFLIVSRRMRKRLPLLSDD